MNKSYEYPTSILGTLLFWGFVVTKAVGHLFAAWSWWWLLLPIVPWIGVLVAHLGW